MEIRKISSIQEVTQLELLNSKLARLESILDYLIKTNNIELPKEFKEDSEILEYQETSNEMEDIVEEMVQEMQEQTENIEEENT